MDISTSLPALILHIGPPKTATTTLQRHVFPDLKSIDYRGKLDYRFLSHDPLYLALYDFVVNQVGSLEAVRKQLQHELSKATHPILLSEENWIKGTFEPNGELSKEKIQRLHAATLGFDVLVVYALRPMEKAAFSAFVQFQGMYGKSPMPFEDLLVRSDAMFPYRYGEVRALLEGLWPRRVFPLDFFELIQGKFEFPGFKYQAELITQSNRTSKTADGSIAYVVRKRYFAKLSYRVAPNWPQLAKAMWRVTRVEKIFVPNWSPEQLESVKVTLSASEEAREQWLSEASSWTWGENGLQ